jgi:hypothetical protein
MPKTPALQRDDIAKTSLLLSWVVLIVATTVLFLHRTFAGITNLAAMADANAFYTSRQLSSFLTVLSTPYDSRAQKLAHASVIVILSAIGLSHKLRARLRQYHSVNSSYLWVATISLAVLLVLNLVPAWWAGASPGRRNVLLYICAFGAVCCWYWLTVRRRRLAELASAVVVLALVAAVTLPGIWRPMDLSTLSTGYLTEVESHYSLVLGAGVLASAGKKLFFVARPYYGVLIPLVTATLERHGYLNSIGHWFQYVRWAQIVYLLLVTSAFYRYANRRLTYCVIPCALLLPWYHFAHTSILFPNQSGLRLLGSAIVTLVAASAAPRLTNRRVAVELGIACTVACLANLETGIPCTAGALLFLWVRDFTSNGTSAAPRWKTYCWFLLAATITVLGWVVAIRASLGYWLFASPISILRSYVGLIRIFLKSGVGGMPLTRDLWPFVMFGHALFVLSFLVIRGAPFSRWDPMRVYVSATFVIWFSYYANRPHPWNTSGFYMYYGFLLIDLLRTLVLLAPRRRFSWLTASAGIVLILGAIPEMVQIGAASNLWPSLRAKYPKSPMISGVYFPADFGRELAERARYIHDEDNKQPVYLTNDSFFIPAMSGVVSDLPFMDSANEVVDRANYEDLMSRLRDPSVSTIYVDAPQSEAMREGLLRRFYQFVSANLAPEFSTASLVHGWAVLRRR